MTLEGPRLLDKVFDGFSATMGNAPSHFPATFQGDNWVALDNALQPTFVNRGYYDLSGYNLEDLTSFIQGVNVQEAWGPRGTAGCFVIDLITTEYVTSPDLIAAYVYPTIGVPFPTRDLPGFPLSTFDMSQVVYGSTREYVAAGTNTNANQYSQTKWGTCGATAVEKLHITRVLYIEPTPANAATIEIPPCDYATAIMVGKEKDLPYLMRLKRSFELSTGP